MASKFDTYSVTTYLVRLANDAKVFPWEREKDGKVTTGEDVVLTFSDDSSIEGTEQMWVDARVADFFAKRAKLYVKGDEVQISGKVRYKRQKDGTLRAKIYGAQIASFVKTTDRKPEEIPAAATSRPAFE